MIHITVNGQKIEVEGNNVSVMNDKIYIDGKEYTPDGEIQTDILIQGSIGGCVESDRGIKVEGSVKGDVTAKGQVSCKDVGGNIKCGGSVSCDDVGGNIHCGGSVNCDDVEGNVLAGGSVNSG